mgnify:CR=1 FL=1
MKTPVRTRLLSALLSLVMLVSLLPVSVFAAEPEAGTWTKVELADITADDTVAITMTKGDSTWVLPNNGDAKAAAKAITGTVSGNTLTTSEKALFGWKVVKGADSFQLVSAATGKYLYSTSSNNGIRQGTGENRDWVVDTESGYLKNVALSRYVGVYNNQDWRSYTSVHANIAGQTLGFWKLSTAPARQSGIVTDLTTLQNGDKVVVFNPANKKALSSVYNGFYNTGVDVELTIDRPQEGWDGHVGFVPNYVKELNPSKDYTVIMCGPPIMIKFTLGGLMELGFDRTHIYTTMELKMKCALGKCGRCNIGNKYVCKDGPVFRFDQLDELPDEY